MIRTAIIFITLTGSLLMFTGCGDGGGPTGPDFSTVPPPFDTTQATSVIEGEEGLKIYVIAEGAGPFEVVVRDQVRIFFTGRRTDGTVFTSSYSNNSNSPTLFSDLTPNRSVSGITRVTLVEGLRRGLLGMKENEKRTIVVPPELGYQNLSSPGVNGFNLRNDTLVYDVELVEIL
ncbi:MAG: FKBP-type peptidyl-prolyl cis-trans isomerase [Balneolaceae bacterium]|nr:FKBP-type peptidyl-prolyl cis-trans isomerase [Balneolaceae bacterium]